VIVVLLAAVAVALAGVAGKEGAERAASPLAKTPLAGTVVLNPAKPVCEVGQPCSKPLAGFKLVFSHRRAVVARTKTDSHGRYRVSLFPGRYAVAAPGHRPGLGRGLAPTRIHVRPVGHQTVNFTYDAGIR
jgi:hypothetical protein